MRAKTARPNEGAPRSIRYAAKKASTSLTMISRWKEPRFNRRLLGQLHRHDAASHAHVRGSIPAERELEGCDDVALEQHAPEGASFRIPPEGPAPIHRGRTRPRPCPTCLDSAPRFRTGRESGFPAAASAACADPPRRWAGHLEARTTTSTGRNAPGSEPAPSRKLG